jgi:hypothetical protein
MTSQDECLFNAIQTATSADYPLQPTTGPQGIAIIANRWRKDPVSLFCVYRGPRNRAVPRGKTLPKERNTFIVGRMLIVAFSLSLYYEYASGYVLGAGDLPVQR